MIKAKSLTKSFGKLQVLKGVDLDIQRGEVVSIVGSSGAGKAPFRRVSWGAVGSRKGLFTYLGKENKRYLGLVFFIQRFFFVLLYFHPLLFAPCD